MVEYKPLVDRAIEAAEHHPVACVVKQRPQAAATLVEGRDVDWDVAMQGRPREPGRVRRGRGDRPALRALHLRHHRQAQGHRARQRRARGGARLVTAQHLRHPPRSGLVGRLRRRLGRRPLLHRLRAAALRCHHRALRGQAGGHPGRRRLLAGHRRAPGGGAVHRAHGDPGDQEGGPGRDLPRAARHLARSATCSWPGSGSTPTPTPGPPSTSASRSWTTGGRPRPDGRSPPTCAGWSRCRSSRVRRRSPCPGSTYGCSTPAARRCRRARRARSACGCRCRRAPCRRCGATTSATSPPTCRRTTGTTSPVTGATSTRTATSS